jgi:hypothetical protein
MHPKQTSIQQQIFNAEREYFEGRLKRPNRPTEAAIKRAAFIDKTYVWKTNAGV